MVIILIIIILGCTAPLADEENDMNQENNPASTIKNTKDLQLEEGLFKGNITLPFSLENMEGDLKSIEDYMGKIIFLNFWSGSCSLCVEELSVLDGFYRENQKETVVIAVNLGEEKQEVDKFIENNNISYPVLLDLQKKVADIYRIQSTPTTYIIDKKGIIRNIHLGPMDRSKMETYQQEALKNYE
jgi:peroxiredoxin